MHLLPFLQPFDVAPTSSFAHAKHRPLKSEAEALPFFDFLSCDDLLRLEVLRWCLGSASESESEPEDEDDGYRALRRLRVFFEGESSS